MRFQLLPKLVGLVLFFFQFSLWDSSKNAKLAILLHLPLSILFMRFLACSSCLNFILHPFNSLYEILRVELDALVSLKPDLSILFMRFVLFEHDPWFKSYVTFNSLYEILREKEVIKEKYIPNFQFSLWDSPSGENIYTDFVYLSILFMRFWHKK